MRGSDLPLRRHCHGRKETDTIPQEQRGYARGKTHNYCSWSGKTSHPPKATTMAQKYLFVVITAASPHVNPSKTRYGAP